MGTREAGRKRLEARAKQAFDELMAWHDATERPTLRDIEEVVLRLRKELGQEMAEVLVSMQEENRPVPEPVCEECGQPRRYKGQKANGVESRAGMLKIERGYYRCPSCGTGFFPPGSATGPEGRELE